MYRYLRPLLFHLDAESAHQLTLSLIRIAAILPGIRDAIRRAYLSPEVPVEAFGLRFKNPVGLAAGYDKDGIGWQGLALLGFGHIELGTVTPLPQKGNPRPRLFRLEAEDGLFNRMGFPSKGANFLETPLLENKPEDIILGVNIGKNASTPLESAAEDYRFLIARFAELADYLVINISSPNTIGLRRLQARLALDKLLEAVVESRMDQQSKLKKKVPLLVKLSPDLTGFELQDAVDVIMQYSLDGVVATNTSTNQELIDRLQVVGRGGISGEPIRTMSHEMVSKITTYSRGELHVIGVGGIDSIGDAKAMLDAGASLVQVYTGLIYQGPGLVKSIVEGLSN